ncbi:SusC/RagA family TonB-linked outer membrane protein [Epilithonimonas zeae]|uniref:TonB-linked outer membrane protein, SusC/RagA family n=1 Tax=Epilithonimonas zeae TaxID=1416779 RepID=A0A1N6ITW5_9FLAO|nr:SusC/RagA family TonB-linked outer membrane protein [Epilithonimonas zeae]SIO35442.1 TonB-linked outer membrane protein, SusC/RagA family [Epilithonimonas zeae]
MNVKLRVLSAGAIFFLGIAANAQKKKADTVTKTNDIEEVVVLGTYGIKETQEQKVGSYSLVTSKTLEKPNALSVDMAIAGQVSGTVITANSGQPGSNAKVLIRGVSSLTGDNQPLYIVDGVPVLVGDQAGVATTSNALAMIDPTDIESVEVLKDGATTSIYGSRAAAGVIIIKTKSGRGGKGKLTMMAEYGFGTPAFERYKFQTAQEQVDALIKGYMALGQSQAAATSTVLSPSTGLLRGWDGVSNTDWEDATRRSATSSSKYNLNYSFGNEKIKGYASIGNTEQDGIIRDASYKRANASIKIDAKINDKISIVSSNMISRATQFGPLDYGYFANPILSARFTPSTNAIYNADGSYNLSINGGTGNAGFNPVAIQNVNLRKSVFTKILSSFGLNYNILKNLRFSSNLGIDYNYYDENEYRNPDFGDGNNPAAGITGLAIQSNYTYTTVNWSNFFNYDFKINDDHKFTATAGSEATIKISKYPYQASTGFKSQHYEQNNVSWGTTPFATQSYTERYHLIGYIGRLSYAFKDYFNLMGSFRRDGYSHFGADRKYGNFWATGANINLHNIVDISTVFDNLKIRGSYGEVGNIGNQNYKDRATLGQSSYQLLGGYTINNPGNPNLQWEVSRKSNIGLDLAFANNTLKVSFDIYKNLVSEQLTNDIPNAPSTGFGTLTGNSLKHESKGFESSLTYDPIKNDNFSWSINGNYSYNRSKVLNLTGPYLDADYFKRFGVGHDPSEWFLANYAGVDHTNGDALWYTNSSQTTLSNGTATAPTISRDYVGKKSIPTHTAGLTNSFSYKKLTISFLATYAGDFSVYDIWGRYYDADGQDVGIRQVADVANAWSPDNVNATRPQYRPGNSVAKTHSTRYLYKGDYIKLKSAEVGFRLNKDDLKIKDLNSIYLYVRGINLLTFAFDKNLPFDPESNSNTVPSYVGGSGVYDQTQPLLRQIMFGAVIDF